MLYRAILLALIATACTEAHDNGPDAGGIMFDANFPDTGTDAGPPPSNVGAACTDDAMCSAPADTCLTEDDFGLPGGYCSTFCSTDEQCGDGAVCITIQMGTSVCLTECEPGANQCRAGYGCTIAAGVGICLPGCEDDTDCNAGLECDPAGGFNGSGACFDPEAAVGDPCDDESECPSGGFCRSEQQGWPDGACTLGGCDFEVDDCPGGSTCVAVGRFALCVDDCASSADCRDGYSCIPTLGFPDRLSCQPTFQPGSLGDACSQGRDPCVGGFCLSEGTYGYPDSYCVSLGCDAGAVPTGCPGDGACFETVSGTGVCFDGCATETDCRAGYACRPVDASDPESPLGCLPGCESDGECQNAGAVCNPGTGLCGDAFAAADLGEPCNGFDDCEGGSCQSEAEDGWPAGMCTYPGCRLSGEGPSATCPTGGVCADDGGGDPTLGVCVESCAAGTSTCRPGYACLPVHAAAPDGPTGCLPDCTADSCGGGRTCNEESGLCE